MKKVKVAGSAGFCAGVKRSVDMAEKLVSEKDRPGARGKERHHKISRDIERRIRETGLNMQ